MENIHVLDIDSSLIINKEDLDLFAKKMLNSMFRYYEDSNLFRVLKKDFLRKTFENYSIDVKQYEYEDEVRNKIIDCFLEKEKDFEEFIQLLIKFIDFTEISTDIIFQIANKFQIDKKTNKEMYLFKEAFLDMYKVYNNGNKYLEKIRK